MRGLGPSQGVGTALLPGPGFRDHRCLGGQASGERRAKSQLVTDHLRIYYFPPSISQPSMEKS
jgi:hypothetical protein